MYYSMLRVYLYFNDALIVSHAIYIKFSQSFSAQNRRNSMKVMENLYIIQYSLNTGVLGLAYFTIGKNRRACSRLT